MVESTNNDQMRRIKDQIHDYMSFSPFLSSIMDTEEFQRLRYIKQLGTSYMVWPGASHNRFEHCLGVAHLARSMVEHLQKQQPELNITERDVNCVQIAGLCHDLGHGPWSHVWDGLFIPTVAPNKTWRHEDASKMMFRSLLQNNGITSLSEKDVKFILALIDGDPKQCSEDEKPFLFDIVANKRNGLDVDKFDYIARDTYMIGESNKLSLMRLIQSARVIDKQICYDIKDVNQLHEICYTRFKLHKTIYNHKTALAVEYMIVDALVAAEPYLKIADQVEDPEKFLFLTDDIMHEVRRSTAPELAVSRAIFGRIPRRDLYKAVAQRIVEWKDYEHFEQYITKERIVQEARRLAVEEGTKIDLADLTDDSVIVAHSEMHYGMKEHNPLNFVKFYSKRNPNVCAPAEEFDYSMLMPKIFIEVKMTIFTKHPQYFGLVQAGYRAVLNSMSEPAIEVEPPSTPPRQPRGLSRGSVNESSFGQVPIDYVPTTPSRNLKRAHDSNSLGPDEEERGPKRQA
ncbi:glycoside hydrolase family 3 protein [Favolaschia claudopus]|uniref:Glycoside hydrolase family 3 protein n=1 Tax=Favolaschia claudopus TaxID=2862362 RepID=A0AAW0DP15_9AGAR